MREGREGGGCGCVEDVVEGGCVGEGGGGVGVGVRTLSIVLSTWRLAVAKQSGRGPPSRQMFPSTSNRMLSLKPRGLVACSEKYLQQQQQHSQQPSQQRF